MINKKIAFIGGGNMAHSLMGGLIAHGCSAENIWATDPSQEKLNELTQQYKVNVTGDNLAAAKIADVVLLAVKPQIIVEVAKQLSPIVKEKKPLIISIAAGVTIKRLSESLGTDLSIVRCMPNTPAMLNCGATGLYANPNVSSSQKELAESILGAVGITIWFDQEAQLDTVTALSGSGPAYFFLIMEAMIQGAEQLGLTKLAARELTLQTALGAATMALKSDEEVATLRKRVTSPGGTTEQGLKVLTDNHIEEIFLNVLKAAKKRSEELSA